MAEANSNLCVNQLNPAKKFGLWVLSLVVRLWQLTLRFEANDADLKLLGAKGEGMIILMWHNQLFSLIEIQNRFRRTANPLYGLVSASKDGAYLATFFEFLKINPVRGSSSRRGAQAAKELVKVLRSNGDVAITVDGPRGPMYKAQPGGALLAVISKKPICLLSCNARNAWRLKSWDRFYLPVPFSLVEIKLKAYGSYEDFNFGKDREAIQASIEKELNQLHDDS